MGLEIDKNRKRFSWVTGGLIAAGLLTMPLIESAEQTRFYVVTNKTSENTVVGYALSSAGGYSMIGEFGTGGTGTGDLEIPALQKDPSHPLANGDDPLISSERRLRNGLRFVIFLNLVIRLCPLSFQRTQSV